MQTKSTDIYTPSEGCCLQQFMFSSAERGGEGGGRVEEG